MNPTHLGVSAADLQTILNQRYGGSANAPASQYTPAVFSGTINGNRVPPQYSRIDADGIGTGAADPMSVPAAGNYNPFLVFTARFAADQAGNDTELLNHPQTFNPFHWPRGYTTTPRVHGQGMDDLVKLASRYIDPKNRYAQTELGQTAPMSFSPASIAPFQDTAVAQRNRALTTPFNVTQSWAEVQIAAQ